MREQLAGFLRRWAEQLCPASVSVPAATEVRIHLDGKVVHQELLRYHHGSGTTF